MTEKMLEENEDSPETAAEPVPRLCSEIQLFDLCELEKCRFKSGKFCTNEELLARFERIADEDAGSRRGLSEDDLDEDDDEFGGFGFDDDDEHNDFAEEDEDY